MRNIPFLVHIGYLVPSLSLIFCLSSFGGTIVKRVGEMLNSWVGGILLLLPQNSPKRISLAKFNAIKLPAIKFFISAS